MDCQYREQVIAYRITMSIIKKMLQDGLITQEEYADIDTIIAKKHGLSSCSIYR